MTQLLVNSCQSGDLILIAGALDAFLDIFSEEYYNQALADQNVIQLMAQGGPALNSLYQNAKAKKLLSKAELANVENALANLEPFIEYKKGVMGINV